jgi:hypothetical protein
LQPDLLAKRIRENLVSQKERLENYLKILEEETDDIIKEDADKLLAHIEIEKVIIDDLTSFKKILDPLEKMYINSPFKKDETIFNLKSSLEKLTGKVKNKSTENQEKLETALIKVKANLQNISAQKEKFGRNVYDKADSRLVDING